MRKLIWFLAGAMALVLVIAVGSLIFLKTRANGFSARAQPSALEEFAAQTARKIAVPEDAFVNLAWPHRDHFIWPHFV